MKRSVAFIMAIMCVLSACGTNASQQTSEQTIVSAETTVVEAQEDVDWLISVEAAEKTDSLANSQAVKQYSGDVANVTYSDKPQDGKVFLLIKLNITKQVVGKSTFSWSNAVIEDNNGNKVSRMADDTFLENYGFKRIKSTDLTMGNSVGYMCAEVDPAATDFTFIYTTADGLEIKVPIPLSLD